MKILCAQVKNYRCLVFFFHNTKISKKVDHAWQACVRMVAIDLLKTIEHLRC